MRAFAGSPTRILVVHLEPDEDLHAGILEACRAAGMPDAVVVDGHATLDPVVIHDVTSTGFPIVEGVRRLDGPFELISIDGLVVDGEIHAHISVANVDAAHGGHLHAGTKVLYLAEVTILGIAFDSSLRRVHEPGSNRWIITEQTSPETEPTKGDQPNQSGSAESPSPGT